MLIMQDFYRVALSANKYKRQLLKWEELDLMHTNPDSYRDIHLILTDDEGYIAWLRRMADRRPPRTATARRSAGEYLGGLVEQCVRHVIGKKVALKPERILAWQQRLKNGRMGPMYRELDAVWQIDDESLCLYEVKFTRQELMEKGSGIKQLNISASILLSDTRWKYVLKRLVYLAAEADHVDVLDGLPELDAAEEYEELGVVWITPQQVEEAATELGLQLPANWTEPEAREGDLEDPERDSWKQFLPHDEATGDEAGAVENSPLAEAMRKALGGE